MAIKNIAITARLAGRSLLGPTMKPSFFIIGAQKAGTTTLFHALSQHPDVLPPIVKETHYFDLTTNRSQYMYGPHFPTKSKALQHEAERGIAPVTFDATPYYMFHPDVAARIKAFAPLAKIIGLLRDPVDRAWSQYWHEWDRGFEHLGPMAALEAEAMRLPSPHEKVGTSARARFLHQHGSYIARSEYDRQIPRWFDLFGRDRVLLIKSERLFTEADAVMAEVTQFLQLAPFENFDLDARNIGKYNDAPPEIAQWLNERLAKSMAATQDLLGKEFHWR